MTRDALRQHFIDHAADMIDRSARAADDGEPDEAHIYAEAAVSCTAALRELDEGRRTADGYSYTTTGGKQ